MEQLIPLKKVTVATQCNQNARMLRDRASQAVRKKIIRTKHAGSQTLPVEKYQPFPLPNQVENKKPRPKVSNFSIQCKPSTKDIVSQTLSLNINKSTQTNDFVTCSVEKGIFVSKDLGGTLLREIINKCNSLELNLKSFLNTRRERTISVTNGKNVGLMLEDVDPVQLMITETGKCTVICPFRQVDVKQLLNVETGTINWDDVESVLNLVKGLNVKFCPGIKRNSDLASGPKFNIFLEPFPRVQSSSCKVFYTSEKMSKVGQCAYCFRCSKVLSNKKKRKQEEDPITMAKRTKVDSKCPISKLSPRNLKSRFASMKRSRRLLINRIAKRESQLQRKDLSLNTEQSGDGASSNLEVQLQFKL